MAFVHRRRHTRVSDRDVLGSVSSIRGIDPVAPHRAHIEILRELSFDRQLRWIEEHNASRNFDGLMASLSAVIFVSRVTTTRSDMGAGLELDVIAAIVLGGTSIFGGTGTIAGTIIGLTLLHLMKNGLALTGVKGDATIVIIGIVLIFSILISNLLQRSRGRR